MPSDLEGGGGVATAITKKMLLDKKWWRGVLFLAGVCGLCIGSIWDRTCNTDPNSADACGAWRLGTMDLMYQNAMHARLSTGVVSPFAAQGTAGYMHMRVVQQHQAICNVSSF